MFKRALLISLASLAGVGLLLTWVILRMDAEDQHDYERFVRHISPHPLEPPSLFQHRQAVDKQLLHTAATPLKHAIRSKRSTIEVIDPEGQPKLIEHMAGVRALYQEALLDTGHLVRELQASHASFDYTKKCLSAREVAFWRKRLPGHDLNWQDGGICLLSGTADKAEVVTDRESGPVIHAQGVHVRICEDREQPIDLSADQLDYSQETAHLAGHVTIKHPIGTLTSDHGHLIGLSDEHPDQFEVARASGNVVIELTDGGRLTCWETEVRMAYHQAICRGLLPMTRVAYSEGKESEALALECDELHLTLAEDGSQQIEQWRAEGSVCIARGSEWAASADEVLYREELPSLHLPAPLAHRYAPPLCLRPFSDLIVLRGHVQIRRQDLGLLTNDREVWIVRAPREGQRQIDTVVSLGTTFLEERENGGTMTCEGMVVLDERLQRMVLEQEGANSFVHLADAQGEARAQRLDVDYASDGEHYALKRVRLSGAVHLQTVRPVEGDPLNLQFAIADEVEYLPTTDEITLAAEKGKRVLFLDPALDTRVSADKMVLQRGTATARGIGRVRFNLSDAEVNQLREVFSLP